MVERLEVSVFLLFFLSASVFWGFSFGNELEAYWTKMQQSLVLVAGKGGVNSQVKKSYQFSSG